MAIDTIPSWVRGPNAAEAISSGASAGAHAASIAAGREESAARLAQDAMQHNQAVQMESARLSQQEHLARMEMQARKEVSEQNQLREQQRLAITDAYHQAELGVQKGRLEEQQAIAEAKARNAAASFQREQNFARDVASGVPVMEAYQRNPVGASVLNAIGRTQDTNKPIHVGEAIVRRQPDGTYKEEYRAPSSKKPIKVGKSLITIDEEGKPHVLYSGETPTSGILGAVAEPPAQAPGLMSRIRNVFSPSAPTPPASTAITPVPKDKTQLKDGQVYETKRGPATWNSKEQHFVPLPDEGDEGE